MSDDRPAAVLVDIDGTLADVTHRRHFIERTPKDWDGFFAAADRDPCHIHIATLTQLLRPAYQIVLVTGRMAKHNAITLPWLGRNWVHFDHLFTRADGDFRGDDVVKEEILDRDILPIVQPVFAIDDRDRVVKMWRRRGIPCLQCAEGDF